MRVPAAISWRSVCFFLSLIASNLQGYGKLPLAFEPNVGQTDRRVSFLARGSGFELFLTQTEAVYRLQSSVVRMRLAGGDLVPAHGVDRLPSESHYLDRKPSITHVPHYGRVEMHQIYRGIDLTYYGNESQLEYDFVVSPDADPHTIAIDVLGADALRIDRHGDLVIHSGKQTIVWRAPAIYQGRQTIHGGYVLRGKHRIGFRVAAYDHRKPLVIDPVLVYSKSIGGTGLDQGFAVAVDSSECAVITGVTASTDFPTTVGAYSTTGGGVFVSKLNAAGTALIYSTFLGPGRGFGIALQGGNAYVTGRATIAFPTTAGALNEAGSGNNVFVTKLTSDGSGLVYSAVFGHGFSQGAAIAVDAAGNAHVTGTTTDSNFTTTTNAFQSTRANPFFTPDIDAFFVKLNASGSAFLYSTYLGSSDADFGEGIAVDASGKAYVAGTTQGQFPTTSGAYSTSFTGGAAGFVSKFDPGAATGAASLVYSTVLGGSGESDKAQAIAVDASGNAYVTGDGGINFPLTAGAYGTATVKAGAFVTKLNANGTALTYSAMIHGADGQSIALDSANNAFIAGGVTSNLDFVPLINPIAGVTGSSLFLTKLNPAGSAVDYATYIDGHLNLPIGVAVDPSGAAYVAGTSFPAPLNTDAFVIKVITNRAPTANAGVDQSVSVGTSFVLDGGASSDPDGDPLTYVWKDSSNAVVGTASSVTLTRPQGVHTFTLTVSDGKSTASDTVDITVYTTLNINLFGGVSGRVTSDDGKIDCTATGSPGCVARYTAATPVTLTAAHGTGVSFTQWVFDCSGSSGCSVNMGANHLVGAQFAVQQLTLSVSTPANGKVKSSSGIDCGSSCSIVVPYGSVVTLTTEAESGYQFDMWSGNCAGTAMSTCSMMMDANKAVGVAFKEIALNALSVAPASATIAVGQQQQFIASGTFSDGSVHALSGDHSLEGADDYTCAITTSGTVKCWGGTPYQTMTTRPVYEKAVMLSAGTSHICALFANGTVTCDGGPMAGVTNAVAIASQSGIPCALIADGTIRCGGVVNALATVSGITNAIAIGAEGGGAACAVLADGTVWCWNGVGDGSSMGSTLPVQIAGINSAIAVTVGAEHACALLSDGTIKCWWRNNRGQLGDGAPFTALTFTNTPVSVGNVTSAISVVAGDYHTCALLSSGTIKCWGMQDANGQAADSSTPTAISGLSNATAVAAGAFHNCATFSNGTVKCWGLNNVGQLGAGNPGSSSSPLPVNGLSSVMSLSWSSGAEARMMASGRAIADTSGMPTITASTGSLTATANLTILNTPPGTNVVTKPIDSTTGGTPATITFASVTTAGSTSVTSTGSGLAPPAGFQTMNPQRYYDITTTATYTAPITICISYAGSISSFPPQLFHFEGGVWKDVTTLIDTVHQIVCGEVSSLSPFALFVRLANHPPIADAGADQAAECGTRVTLDGSRSSDPDHDRLTYVWTGTFGRIEGRTASVVLPAGANVVTLTVSDGLTTASDTVAVTIRDTVAPAIRSVTAMPNVLWPPNHKMIPVTVTASASDICDPAVRCRIVEVTSNEPDDEAWKIEGDLTLQLKAERSGNGNGRIYTITVRCTDASGNSSSKTVTVTVPRSSP